MEGGAEEKLVGLSSAYGEVKVLCGDMPNGHFKGCSLKSVVKAY